LKEYGALPDVGFAVTLPIPEEQMSAVGLAVTEEETPVTQDVSGVTDPIPTPQAEPVKKYPVVPAAAEGMFNTPLLYGKVCPFVFPQTNDEELDVTNKYCSVLIV